MEERVDMHSFSGSVWRWSLLVMVAAEAEVALCGGVWREFFAVVLFLLLLMLIVFLLVQSVLCVLCLLRHLPAISLLLHTSKLFLLWREWSIVQRSEERSDGRWQYGGWTTVVVVAEICEWSLVGGGRVQRGMLLRVQSAQAAHKLTRSAC